MANTHLEGPICEQMQIRLVPITSNRPVVEGCVAILAFNRPKRANALSPQTYREWLQCVEWTTTADHVRAVLLTGNGKFYCTGQELMPIETDSKSLEQDLRQRGAATKTLVDRFIDFPKLLVAAVNGPAFGFGVTTLALCDVVYAAKEARFKTPFMELGFCAEGCSSYLFPKIMGQSLANEMILMGRQLDAEEMLQCGYISRILPSENFLQHALDLTLQASRFPPNAIRQTKRLIMSDAERRLLHDVNDREMTLLLERMLSEECHQAVIKFIAKMKPGPKL